jgi:hypothetical protein
MREEITAVESPVETSTELLIPAGFKDKHVQVLNENGTLTIKAEKRTRIKSTGERRYHFVSYSVTDPSLEGKKASVKDGKIILE